MNLLAVFLTGLTTGGVSCLAVQGGLLTSTIANHKEAEYRNKTKKLTSGNWAPVLMFISTKIIAHTIIGFLLGAIGSAITLSIGVSTAFQIFVALFMFATAMNLLDVHPIFRYLAFTPPKLIQKKIRLTSKSNALFAPAILGILTIFIPCGVTQAMEVLAINTGNPVYGALLMLAFTLGTSPLFIFVGILTAKFSEKWNQLFTKLGATILIIMALLSINGVLLVLGSPVSLQTITHPITYYFSDERFEQMTASPLVGGVQKVQIDIVSGGYSPTYFKVRAGYPVELTLESHNAYSCALSFIMNDFNIHASLAPTDRQVVTFTPNRTGRFIYTCSMGMYSGTMEVI